MGSYHDHCKSDSYAKNEQHWVPLELDNLHTFRIMSAPTVAPAQYYITHSYFTTCGSPMRPFVLIIPSNRLLASALIVIVVTFRQAAIFHAGWREYSIGLLAYHHFRSWSALAGTLTDHFSKGCKAQTIQSFLREPLGIRLGAAGEARPPGHGPRCTSPEAAGEATGETMGSRTSVASGRTI